MARQSKDSELKDENEKLKQEIARLQSELGRANIAIELAQKQREEQATKHLETLVGANVQLKEQAAQIQKLDGEVKSLAEQVAQSKGK